MGSLIPIVALALAAAAPAKPVVLAFAGDVMLDGEPGRTIAEGGDPIAGFAPLLSGVDAFVVNLECPIATGGEAVDKRYTFRAHPRTTAWLAPRVAAVTLANNHSGDYGPAALLETLDLLRSSGIPSFGAGRNLAEAHAPIVLERGGLRIALLGYDHFLPRAFEATSKSPGVAWAEVEQVVADLRRVRESGVADLVIPVFHWGWEGEQTPTAEQRELARRAIEAGATAVVGGHPHVVQTTEHVHGRPVIYSLGNFVFDGFETPETTTGWLLRLELDRTGVRRWDTVVAHLDAKGSVTPVFDVPSPCGEAGASAPTSCVIRRSGAK